MGLFAEIVGSDPPPYEAVIAEQQARLGRLVPSASEEAARKARRILENLRRQAFDLGYRFRASRADPEADLPETPEIRLRLPDKTAAEKAGGILSALTGPLADALAESKVDLVNGLDERMTSALRTTSDPSTLPGHYAAIAHALPRSFLEGWRRAAKDTADRRRQQMEHAIADARAECEQALADEYRGGKSAADLTGGEIIDGLSHLLPTEKRADGELAAALNVYAGLATLLADAGYQTGRYFAGRRDPSRARYEAVKSLIADRIRAEPHVSVEKAVLPERPEPEESPEDPPELPEPGRTAEGLPSPAVSDEPVKAAGDNDLAWLLSRPGSEKSAAAAPPFIPLGPLAESTLRQTAVSRVPGLQRLGRLTGGLRLAPVSVLSRAAGLKTGPSGAGGRPVTATSGTSAGAEKSANVSRVMRLLGLDPATVVRNSMRSVTPAMRAPAARGVRRGVADFGRNLIGLPSAATALRLQAVTSVPAAEMARLQAIQRGLGQRYAVMRGSWEPMGIPQAARQAEMLNGWRATQKQIGASASLVTAPAELQQAYGILRHRLTDPRFRVALGDYRAWESAAMQNMARMQELTNAGPWMAARQARLQQIAGLETARARGAVADTMRTAAPGVGLGALGALGAASAAPWLLRAWKPEAAVAAQPAVGQTAP